MSATKKVEQATDEKKIMRILRSHISKKVVTDQTGKTYFKIRGFEKAAKAIKEYVENYPPDQPIGN